MSKDKQIRPIREALHGVRGILAFSVGMSLVYGLLKLAGPLFMILVFDRVLPARSVETLIALLGLLIITIGVMTLLDYSRRRILARFGARFQERVEQHIFGSASRDSYLTKGGRKPAPGLNEADQLRGFFHSGSLITILDFLWSPVFLGVIFVIDPLIGWVVVVGVALLASINLARGLTQHERVARSKEASDAVIALKDTILVSRHVVDAQQMTSSYNRRWLMARRHTRDAAIELKDWTAWFSITASHTALLVQYVALAAGAYQTISGDITIGAMVASMYLARHVVNRAERFLVEVPGIQEARRNWRTLDKILVAPHRPVGSIEAGSELRACQATVRCALTKRVLLRNINAVFSPGSTIEIVGASGSGKTVLAEVLIGRISCSSGKVLLGHVDVERIAIDEAGMAFGYVPQRVDFLDATIEENLQSFSIESNAERLACIARIAGIHHRIAALPDGYRTRIDVVGSVFSKAERHQLALVRALYRDPQILLIDDPDATLVDALASELNPTIRDFTNAGGMLIVLTRTPLKLFRATHRYSLDAGLLREIKPDRPVLDRAERQPAIVGPRSNLA